MGKILTFIGGCLTGVLGVFAVAVMSDSKPCAETSNAVESDEKDSERRVETYLDNPRIGRT